MSQPRHVPMRLCLGCNESAPGANMVRFTLDSDRLMVDQKRRQGGRGGYLHMEKSCIEAFRKRKPMLRSLRASVPAAERERFVAALGIV